MIASKAFRAIPFAGARSLGKPTATFPGAVAGDAQLAVAVDREQTKLAAPLSEIGTSMTVQNAAGLAIWSLLSIEDEIVQVNNAISGNVVPIRRGFDGTTPALHLAGATVAGLIDAYHHNTLVAEVEAIEAALGANLANVSGAQQVINTAFDFPAQSPGGTLTVGANVVLLSPVPRGVNGTDAHYLYISGGTGAAEYVPIIGGTAVSGAASGTVILQCANTHSGAWTIRSATAGIQEAYQTLATIGNGGTIYIAAGLNTIYAPIGIKAPGITIAGASPGSSLIKAANNANITSDTMIHTYNTAKNFNLFNCIIDGNRTNTGMNPTNLLCVCVFIAGRDSQVVGCEIRESAKSGLAIGDSSIEVQNVAVDRCYIWNNGRIDGNGPSGSGFGGVGLGTVGTLGVNDLRITNCRFFHNTNGVVQPGDGAGINLGPCTNVLIANNYFQDNWNAGGGQCVIDAEGGGTCLDVGYIVTGNTFFLSGPFGTPGDQTDGVEVACRDFVITNNVMWGHTRYGVNLDGPGCGDGSVTGNVIFAQQKGMACLNYPTHTVDHVIFSSNAVNVGGNAFETVPVHTYISVKNNTLLGVAAPFSGTFGTGCEVVNNLVNAVQPPRTVTVTASPMTYTAGFTEEMVAIKGGTTLTVAQSGNTICSNSPNATWTWLLRPGVSITITYTGAPAMTVVPLD